MSCPISSCLVIKACSCEESYVSLREQMRINMRFGHWSQFPCHCNPPCGPVTDEQIKAVNDRLAEDLKGVTCESNGYDGVDGTPGEEE